VFTMSRKAAITVGVTICAVGLLSGGLWFIYSSDRNGRMLSSDVNHAIFVSACIEQNFFMEDHPPPYEAGVPGYIMMENICSNYPVAWCNHGRKAGYQYSGWQALNLSPEQWIAFQKTWSSRDETDVPFAWCGRPTGLNKRLIFYISSQCATKNLRFAYISETDIKKQVKRINEVLSEIRAEPVSLDIPVRNKKPYEEGGMRGGGP
jgi:hypothetical protein